MGKTKIQWADNVWNPVTGCTPVSIGCANCYARRMANRLRGRCGYPANESFRVTLHPERLEEPLHWREPRMIFICSMGDLFHEDVPTTFIDAILEVVAVCSQHTFIALTKRPENIESKLYGVIETHPFRYLGGDNYLPNLWLGVSVENQEMADRRIPILLQIPTAKRVVSVEPMLGPVDLMAIQFDPYTRMNVLEGCGVTSKKIISQNIPNCFCNKLDWVICGAETGPRARPMKHEWAESLLDQCQSARVPFFYKQGPDDNGNFTEMPILRGKVWGEIPY